MSDLGYTVNLEKLCETESFSPSQVVSSELVYPKGAVPNAQLIWFRVELTSGERTFCTRSLSQFHEFVNLPESSIGGWTDGDRGLDSTGHYSRYALDDSVSGEEVSGELQRGAEGAEEPVAS